MVSEALTSSAVDSSTTFALGELASDQGSLFSRLDTPLYRTFLRYSVPPARINCMHMARYREHELRWLRPICLVNFITLCHRYESREGRKMAVELSCPPKYGDSGPV